MEGFVRAYLHLWGASAATRHPIVRHWHVIIYN